MISNETTNNNIKKKDLPPIAVIFECSFHIWHYFHSNRNAGWIQFLKSNTKSTSSGWNQWQLIFSLPCIVLTFMKSLSTASGNGYWWSYQSFWFRKIAVDWNGEFLQNNDVDLNIRSQSFPLKQILTPYDLTFALSICMFMYMYFWLCYGCW